MIFTVVLLGASCISAPPLDPDPPSTETDLDWRYMRPGWPRLEAIEDFLVGYGPVTHPEYVVEAELLLAEGRLQFARDERDQIPATAMRMRLGAAEGGFRRVMDDPRADISFRGRAERGLDGIRELRGGNAGGNRVPAGVIARSRWSAMTPDKSNLTPHLGPYTRITVHHTAMHSSNLGRRTEPETAQAIHGIQRQHMNQRGYGDIGYHFLIDPVGRVWEGRSLAHQGAHAGGANNVANVGICLLGNFEVERPSSAALRSLESLVGALRKKHGIPCHRVFGHRDFKVTDCPGRNLAGWVERYQGGRIAAR